MAAAVRGVKYLFPSSMMDKVPKCMCYKSLTDVTCSGNVRLLPPHCNRLLYYPCVKPPRDWIFFSYTGHKPSLNYGNSYF